MNILFVTARPPYPPFKGDRLRPYHFIKELSRRHKIDLCSFFDSRDELLNFDEMKKYCNRIEPVFLSSGKSYINCLRSIVNFKPFQVSYYYSSLMKNKVNAMANDGNYDIIHVVLQRMMEYVPSSILDKVVLDQIDALSLNMQRRAVTETNIIRKAVFYLEYRNMKRYEQSAKKYSACVVTSEADKEALENEHIYVIPNGVDAEYFAPALIEKDIDLIFTGNMGYFPNIDSVLYFTYNILPKILTCYPSLKFYIVGINPTRVIRKLADNKNIFVTGFVNDLKHYLNRSKIFVAPLRSGSGIQNKILEAMSCALPVVTTRYGNAGIRAELDREIIVADGADLLKDRVIALLNDNANREKVGRSAREFVERDFSWQKRIKMLEGLYESVSKNR